MKTWWHLRPNPHGGQPPWRLVTTPPSWSIGAGATWYWPDMALGWRWTHKPVPLLNGDLLPFGVAAYAWALDLGPLAVHGWLPANIGLVVLLALLAYMIGFEQGFDMGIDVLIHAR